MCVFCITFIFAVVKMFCENVDFWPGNFDKQRIQKWEKLKKEKKEKRTECPFSCGKSWKNIYNSSVKLHLLEKCPNRIGNEEKLIGFFKRKKIDSKSLCILLFCKLFVVIFFAGTFFAKLWFWSNLIIVYRFFFKHLKKSRKNR